MFSFPYNHREEMSGEFPHISHPEFVESLRGGRGGHFHGRGRRNHGGPPGFGREHHAEFFAGRGRGGRGRGGFRHGGRGRHSASESDGDEYAELVKRFREMGHGHREHSRRRFGRREREVREGDKTPKGYAVESDSEDFVDVDGERKDNDNDNDNGAASQAPGERGWGRRGHHHWHGRYAHGFAGPGELDFAPRRGGHGPHAFMMGPPPHGPHFSHHHHPGRHGHFKKPFPRVDIFESEKQYVLEIEVPGVRKDVITALVSEDGRSITVEGTFPARAEGTLERVYGERRVAPGEKFARTIPLPGLVDKENVSAKLTDGVLIVALDKVQVEEPKGTVMVIE
ncbi:unnamed protein product [Peniophora sp. CBMAI 1063]|nr:unnamed protein product [Peniophora sp. CBMAI 1063]